MNNILNIIFCLFGTCNAGVPVHQQDLSPAAQELNIMDSELADFFAPVLLPPEQNTDAGNYLSSQFAQRHHDWKNAVAYMEPLLASSPDDTQLLSRTMILAMGSGDTEKAIDIAKELIADKAIQDADPLPLLFTALHYFKLQDYKKASEYIDQMPSGSLSEFIMPLLHSWTQAALGVYDIKGLDKNTIHVHHAILISDYMGKTEGVEALLEKSLGASGLSLNDLERIADGYTHIGKYDLALEIYEKLYHEWPENRPLGLKTHALQSGEKKSYLQDIHSPEEGVAEALFDMARLLFQEHSDDSARVFSHMALYLNSDLTDAKLLLGYITARNDHYDDAIAYYRQISPDNPKYSESRRMAADLLESHDRADDAIKELQKLVNEHKDLEALIQIGDIYRRNEEFDKAVVTYNKAAKVLGENIPQEYWQLYYVRGMSYERLGEWKKAEHDLEAAMEYQPENPLVLNYLGYAWADQGVNLEKSLELIRKAAALRPSDGYIIDSLGWVLFRMGKYEEAVPHLERAVELLPYDPVINDHLGDAYWKVDRHLEAKFQWRRAQGHSEDEELIQNIQAKLEDGLDSDNVKAAQSQAHPMREAQ